MQDVIDRLGTNEWCRLRVGIGSAVGDPSDYVLERFDKLEEDLIERAREYAADAVECWVRHGIDLAMARFNGDPPGTTR